MPDGEHGDFSGEVQGEHQRAIFHDRQNRVMEVRVHHLSVSFLLRRALCAREAAIIAIAVTGEHMQFDCQAADKDRGPWSRAFAQASGK
jgi:hypothetical protein